MPHYDSHPTVAIQNVRGRAWRGFASIAAQLRGPLASAGGRVTLVVECYPGVNERDLLQRLTAELGPREVVHTAQLLRSPSELASLLAPHLTEDRVFGNLSAHEAVEFFDPDRLARQQEALSKSPPGLTLILGTGATLIAKADLLLYVDLPRWEIQKRMRRHEVGNWGADNLGEEFLRKYKRSYFVDWRVADRHKQVWLPRADYYLDATVTDTPQMTTVELLRDAWAQVVAQPFRVVPFFDPGVWGGQWMKEHFGLDPQQPNYAWGFDCVPEENSLLLDLDGVVLETPAINLVLFQPQALLGDAVLETFGPEFPIRFDLLDTMEGGNLSLQVHPRTDYIRQQFGMAYTQDESYYMLDVGADARVFLGLKDGVDPEKMWSQLEVAAQGGEAFPAEAYVNAWPARKHDHFSIPAGTIHCSGRNSVVLEISATPYIFTFKLWDWGRLGLDGRPRPLHLEHGRKNVNWDRDTAWTRSHLIDQTAEIGHGTGWREERTGLHASQFIETRRHWFSVPVAHDTAGNLNVLNLVEGESVLVESPTGAFAPFTVHYAETFIVPAQVGRYTIRPLGGGGAPSATLKAYVRTSHG